MQAFSAALDSDLICIILEKYHLHASSVIKIIDSNPLDLNQSNGFQSDIWIFRHRYQHRHRKKTGQNIDIEIVNLYVAQWGKYPQSTFQCLIFFPNEISLTFSWLRPEMHSVQDGEIFMTIDMWLPLTWRHIGNFDDEKNWHFISRPNATLPCMRKTECMLEHRLCRWPM